MKNIDFLPETYRLARQQRALRIRRVWLGAICLCALATWFVVDEVRLQRTRLQLEGLTRQNQTVRASLEHIAQLQAEHAVLLDRYKLVQELQPSVSYVGTICRIAELLPEPVVLRQLQLSCSAAPVTAGESAGAGRPQVPGPMQVRMALAGLAPSQVDIAVLVGHLSSCREFANVRLDYCKAAEINSRQAHEFRVTFDVMSSVAASQAARGV